MIEAKDITKKFGALRALSHVSFTAEAGECIALIGPNGSGKTTLIKSILGMVLPDEGDILFNGKSIRNAWDYRKHIGYMPQIGRYPENMTISQILAMMCDIRNTSLSETDNDLVNDFDLGGLGNKRMRTLSGGTRQKVSAAIAFLFRPDVLILDEPSAGLDPLATEMLRRKILKEKANGKLILITSHVLSELDDLSSAVIYMQDGELKFHTSTTNLLEETGERRLSRAVATLMLKSTGNEKDTPVRIK